MEPQRGTRAAYDVIAESFLARTSNRETMMPFLDRFAERVASGGIVLDVGGGPGFDGAILRDRGFRVSVLDFSLGMLRTGLRDYPGPRVQADMRKLPIRDRCLAGIWANASLLHLERPDVVIALDEFRRVLCSDGVLHVGVKRGEGARWVTRRGEDQPRWFTYWSANDLDEQIRAAGFEIEDARMNETEIETWLIRLARPR